MLGNEGADLRDFPLAPHERLYLLRQIVRARVERSQRRKLCRNVGGDELTHALGPGEVAQAVLAEVAQARSRRQRSAYELRRDARKEHLTAMRDAEQA